MAAQEDPMKALEELIRSGKVTVCKMSPEETAEYEARKRWWDEADEENQDTGEWPPADQD